MLLASQADVNQPDMFNKVRKFLPFLTFSGDPFKLLIYETHFFVESDDDICSKHYYFEQSKLSVSLVHRSCCIS